MCLFQASKIKAKLQFYDYVSAKKKAKLVTAQQTLYFTQTREKPRENDAGRALEIEDTGEGRERGPQTDRLMVKMFDLIV